jgi:hypothetical protein
MDEFSVMRQASPILSSDLHQMKHFSSFFSTTPNLVYEKKSTQPLAKIRQKTTYPPGLCPDRHTDILRSRRRTTRIRDRVG